MREEEGERRQATSRKRRKEGAKPQRARRERAKAQAPVGGSDRLLGVLPSSSARPVPEISPVETPREWG
jgi:hypothetical protein